jgi:hypothetical protein
VSRSQIEFSLSAVVPESNLYKYGKSMAFYAVHSPFIAFRRRRACTFYEAIVSCLFLVGGVIYEGA